MLITKLTYPPQETRSSPADTFTLTQGRVGSWSRPTPTGKLLECQFCVACGTRIRHADRGGATISVKGGSLDRPPDLTSAFHIWTSRRLPGLAIPDGATQFAE